MKKRPSKIILWLWRHGWGAHQGTEGFRLYTVREELAYRWYRLSTWYTRRSMSRALIKKRAGL